MVKRAPAKNTRRWQVAATALAWSCTSLACTPREPERERAAPAASALAATTASALAATTAEQPSQDCKTLSHRLCAEFGEASDVCGVVSRRMEAMRPERCAAMLARYGQVASEAQRLATARQALFTAKRGSRGDIPGFGPAQAKVTIVEFSDFDCANCARASRMATSIRNLYGSSVRFLFRQFPLATHQNARLAAEASLAAHEQGKFWEYHDTLFANQHELDQAALVRYAAEAGLDTARFQRDLEARRFASDVDADRALGRELFIDEVPALFVNGEPVEVPYGVAELTELVERALAAGS